VATIEIPQEIDRFVVYFDTPRHDINAYSLATSLIGLADAIREANAAVNPGYAVEVVVEALGDGSFRAIIRTLFESARNLFSNEAVKAIVYGIIATYIYETALKVDRPVQVIVSDDQVIVESGSERIVVPKTVYEAKRKLEQSERFRTAIGQVVHGASRDESVVGIGLTHDQDSKRPPLYVPRERFAIFDSNRVQEEGVREVVEFANLEISRAILARGNRKWEFYWRGVKISAPILDTGFFDRFFAHEITIAPGDGLRVVLRIVQRMSQDTGIFVNERYEVVEVLEHVPRMQQAGL